MVSGDWREPESNSAEPASLHFGTNVIRSTKYNNNLGNRIV